MDNATKCQTHSNGLNYRPNHDRDWIVGCIKHDGFIKTDRGDKANQIILEALQADMVEVVRCKECRHRVHDEERGLYYCEMYYGQGDVSDENFCQWGERSE